MFKVRDFNLTNMMARRSSSVPRNELITLNLGYIKVLAGTLICLILALAFSVAKVSAADNQVWFWCSAANNDDTKVRNFYSNVFKGGLDYKGNYERAFGALIAARILRQPIQGDVVCFFNQAKGEARREQNEFALERRIAKGGSIEFIDWSY